MKKSAISFIILFISVTLVNTIAQESSEPKKAICVVSPTQGNVVTGVITFIKVEEGIKVIADIQGLSKGKHGFHIHEFGDCSAPDGTSAGGHFNPSKTLHGAPHVADRHAGDMGNIEADESGKGHLEYVDRTIAMDGEGSIIGKSMIIHANKDDYSTQPTGNAGARIACGIIEVAK